MGWQGPSLKACHNILRFVNLCYCEHSSGWFPNAMVKFLGCLLLQDELQAFREQYVAKWILHADNVKRAEIIFEIQD